MIEPSSGSKNYQTAPSKKKWWKFWKGRKVAQDDTTKVSTGHTIVRSRRLTTEEWQAEIAALQKMVQEEKHAVQK